MLDLLKSYLVKLPTPTTAPLYQQVNTANVLAVLSTTSAVAEVKCYSTSPDEQLPTCYLVVREVPNTANMLARNQSGGGRLESVLIEVEINSSGSTDTEAEGRAEVLRQEVDVYFMNNRAAIVTGTNALGRTPVNTGESAKTDKLQSIFTNTTPQRGDVSGPGADKTKPQWQCKRYVRSEVWVYRGR